MKKFDGFSEKEVKKLERAFSDRPNYKTTTGYTGNKKSRKDRQDWKVGQKRRRTDHLTNKERKKLAALHKQVDDIFVSSSFISRKSDEKLTKKDMKKGENSNLGARGIHGSSTFVKYKKNCKTFVKYCLENFEINHLSEITKGMYYDFMEEKMAHGKPNGEPYSSKSLDLYKNSIQKLAEESLNGGKEYQRLARLAEADVKEKYGELKERHGMKYSKSDYKRGKNNGERLGYSYKESRRIISKAHEISPYHGAMYEVLAHGAPRHEELLKIKWRQVDTVNNRIFLDDPNQTKTGRPRFIPIPEATSQKLQEMMDLGLAQNPDTRIWGSRMSKDDVYNLTKDLCRQSHIGYSGVHDFRRAATEYHVRELKKEYKQGKVNREQLVERFLQHVRTDERLNPIEIKMERKRDENGKVIYKHLTDSQGNPRYYPNGKPRLQSQWIPKRDKNGEYVRDHRYTEQEVKEWRIDKLVNSIVSQVLGHNRTDVTSVYKNG